MDDDKKNSDENQPTPLYESVPQEEGVPEEVPADVSTPEEALSSAPAELPDDLPPVYHESRMKYVVVAGGFIVFILIFLLLFKFILGRGGGTSANATLNYWGLWEEKEVFEPLIAAYKAKNPGITVNYEKLSPQSYREKIIARSKNNQGPDIFRFHNTWVPELQEILAPLDSSVMTNADFEKTFYPIHAKDLKVGQYYYGIPLEIDGLVLIYNDTLFKNAGISKAPANWDELIDSAVKLTVKDADKNIITSGIALGTASNVEHFSDIFGLMLLQNGADLKKLDTPEAAGTLEGYRKFAEKADAAGSTNVWDETMPNSVSAFIQGKVAMIIAPSWEVITIKAANPDINVKTAPVPSVPGSNPLSLASYWVEGVSRYSKNQIEAWKFLKFLSEKEQMTKLYEIESKVRFFGEPYSRVDLGSSLSQHEYLGSVIGQGQYYFSLPVVSRTFDNGLNDEIVKYIENAINATTQGVSYSQALITAKQGVDQVFSKYKIQ